VCPPLRGTQARSPYPPEGEDEVISKGEQEIEVKMRSLHKKKKQKKNKQRIKYNKKRGHLPFSNLLGGGGESVSWSMKKIDIFGEKTFSRGV